MTHYRQGMVYRALVAGVISLAALLSTGCGGSAHTIAVPLSGKPSITEPVIVGVADSMNADQLTVAGHGFTPSGEVFVIVYDHTRFQSYDFRAHEVRYSAQVSDVATLENSSGTTDDQVVDGAIRESIDYDCGVSVSVRAYDQGSQRWSDWIDIEASC